MLIIRHLNRAISTSENDHPSPPVFSHCPNCLNPQDEQSCERSKVSEEFQSDKVARILHLAYSVAGSCFMLSMVAWRSFKEKPFRQARNAAWDNMKLPLLRVMMQWNKSGGLFQLKLAYIVNTKNPWWIMKRTANPFQRVQNMEVEEQKLGKLSIRKATSNVPTAKGTVHERNSAPVEIAI